MAEKSATFRVLANGPLEIKGAFKIVGTNGKIVKTEDTTYLCRCGGSENKPFCDNTHRKIGFSG